MLEDFLWALCCKWNLVKSSEGTRRKLLLSIDNLRLSISSVQGTDREEFPETFLLACKKIKCAMYS